MRNQKPTQWTAPHVPNMLFVVHTTRKVLQVLLDTVDAAPHHRNVNLNALNIRIRGKRNGRSRKERDVEEKWNTQINGGRLRKIGSCKAFHHIKWEKHERNQEEETHTKKKNEKKNKNHTHRAKEFRVRNRRITTQQKDKWNKWSWKEFGRKCSACTDAPYNDDYDDERHLYQQPNETTTKIAPHQMKKIARERRQRREKKIREKKTTEKLRS